MHILFGWGKNVGKDDLKYLVTDFNVSLASSDEFAGGLGNCVPGSISVSIEIPPNQKAKPAVDLFKFAKNQHDVAKNEGGGKIIVYEGIEVGQPIQEVNFEKAWITDISSGASRHDQQFNLHLTIQAASVQVSDVKFEDKRKSDLVLG
jgi:hypothetical protein